VEQPEVETDEDLAVRFAARPLDRLFDPNATFVLTRFVLLRWLGLVYFFAFLALAIEGVPLFGARGILPIADLVRELNTVSGGGFQTFRHLPSLFFIIGASDTAIRFVAWTGVALSFALLAGATNGALMAVLWILYASISNLGQDFTGFGWEIQLLETGILAAFLCPIASLRPFPKTPPPTVIIWAFRWLIVRIMWGAGLIKVRNDPCWRDLTCLAYHYQTQPLPNPLSPVLHHAPMWFHKLGVIVNHAVELGAPFFAFGPRVARNAAGISFIGFQFILIASGNLSFLNWLTIVPAIGCFDDRALAKILPAGFVRYAERATTADRPTNVHRYVALGYALVVAILSFEPIANLLSEQQAMNRSYEPLHLVNTYGAFGSIDRERVEVILEGTSDADIDEHTKWLPYELPCKPGDVMRRPCVVGPYHHRLDWQFWFLRFAPPEDQGWYLHMELQLLRGDREVGSLFAKNPFRDAPPRFLRAELYRYEFAGRGDPPGAWWRRTKVQDFSPPVSLDDPEFDYELARFGWSTAPNGD